MLSNKIKSYIESRTGEVAVLIAGVGIYCTAALVNISKPALWLDEAFTAYIIKYNFVDILRYTAADVHPPLYYWLLKIWTVIFGNTELGLRSFSVALGVLAIIIGYLLVKKLFGKYPAQFSLLLMILSPLFLRYSREARMYTLMTAIALAATYTLVIAMKSKKKLPWVIYGVLLALGMLTHYFSAIVWMVHWLWRADVARHNSRGRWAKSFFSKDWIIAHVVAFLVFLPWLPIFIYQYTVVQVSGFWIPIVSVNTLPNYLTNVVYYLNADETVGWLAFAFVAAATCITYLARKVYKNLGKEGRENYRLIMAIAFMPAIILFFLSMPPLRSLFIDRYLTTSALMIGIFTGVTLTLGYKYIGPKARLVLFAIIPVMMIYGVGVVQHSGNLNKTSNTTSQTKETMQFIGRDSSERVAVITDVQWLLYEMVYYETDKNPVYFIDEKTDYRITALDMLHYSDQHKIKDIQTFTRTNPVVWHISSISSSKKYQQLYPTWRVKKELVINDKLTGKPAYQLVKYITN